MTRFIAIQGCIAVLSALLLGPFTHVHQSVGHDDHAVGEETTIVHSHVSFDAAETTESSRTTVRQAGNAAARQLTIFDFRKESPAPQPSLVIFALYVPELIVHDFVPDVPNPVAHAPPGVDCSGLRSPPA